MKMAWLQNLSFCALSMTLAADAQQGTSSTAKSRDGTGGEAVTFAKCKVCPRPEYTAEAAKARLQGEVLLRVFIGEDGKAKEIIVMKPLGMGLDQKAVEAVNRWLFEPPRRAGKAVAAWNTVELAFRLHDHDVPWEILEPRNVASFSNSPGPPLMGPRNGDVILEVVFDRQGKVEKVTPISSSHIDLVTLATEAVRTWDFKKAAESSGAPTSVVIKVEFKKNKQR